MEDQAAGWLLALEHSGFGAAMRGSTVLYPVANVAHVLGLAGFAAAVTIMDVRLLGGFPQLPVRPFVARWRRVAVAAFLVQVVSGVMLFAAEASAIAANPVFLVKLLLIAVGLANVAVFELAMRPHLADGPAGTPLPAGARFAAALSLAAWLGTAAAGRLIAYF